MRVYDRVGDAASVFRLFKKRREFSSLIHYFNYTIAGLLDAAYTHEDNLWVPSAGKYENFVTNIMLSDEDKVRVIILVIQTAQVYECGIC